MSKEEFGKLLRTLQFKKVNHCGAKGYYTVVPTEDGKGYGITCCSSPDVKAKRALDEAWEMMLKQLATRYGYKGDLASFR